MDGGHAGRPTSGRGLPDAKRPLRALVGSGESGLLLDERTLDHIIARLADARRYLKPRASSSAQVSFSIDGLPHNMARSVSGFSGGRPISLNSLPDSIRSVRRP